MLKHRASLRWALPAAAGLLLVILLAPRLFATARGAPLGQVYLPLVQDAGKPASPATPPPTATPTVTPVPTARPKPTLDPAAAATTDGACPSGFHLIHETGNLGIIGPDDFDGLPAEGDGLEPVAAAARRADAANWTGYWCVPDQDLGDISCSNHGTAVLIGGVATCECDDGYVGRQCNLCGPGYALSADKTQCIPAPDSAPSVEISGTADSVEAGSVIELSAVVPQNGETGAAQVTVPGTWSIGRGLGCLLASRDSETCVETVQGDRAWFKSFVIDGNVSPQLRTAEINFVETAGGGAPVQATVLSQPPGYIPINGFGRPELQPILDQLLDYMKTRCIGAAVLGVGYYGKPVGVWGLGKTFGRASSVIFDPTCGTNTDDPHYPSAPNTGNQMGIMIGSVSKTVTWATARWTLKNALAAWDTDVDVAALSQSQIVTAQRQGDGQLRLEAWSVNSAGVSAKQGTLILPGAFKDFDLIQLSATRVAVAVRSLNDTLAIHVVDVSGAGQFTAAPVNAISGLPGSAGDTIIQVRLARLSDTQILAALRRDDDTVTFVVWNVGSTGVLTQLNAQALTTRARDLELIVLDASAQVRVVLGIRDVSNRLTVTAYDVTLGGALNSIASTQVLGEIDQLALATLSPTRFAAGVRRDDGTLTVQSWELVLSGAPSLSQRDSDNAGPIGDLALARIGASGFAAVVRAANGGLNVTSWVLDSGGILTRRGDDTAGTNNGAALANLIYGGDTLNSILFVAVRTGEQALKVIAWNVTGPTPSRQANEGNGAGIGDHAWTDTDVEALRLVGFGLPQGMLPEPARSYFGGELPLPVDLPGATITDDGVVVAQCDALPAGGFAEATWKTARLKHVFAHRTGMAKSFSPDYTGFVTTYLDDIRGLSLQGAWADQEEALRNTFGAANVEAGRTALGWNPALISNGDTDGYLIPTPTMAEWAQVFASRCTPYTYGTYQYANTGPQIMRTVIEHVSGIPQIFPEGFPSEHQNTLFYQFLNDAAGIPTSPTNNIYPRKTALESAADLGDPGPRARLWNGATYYSTEWDVKRPFCTWDGNACSFTAWKDAADGRLTWYWVKEQAPRPYGSSPLGTATGGMRAEPQWFLKFMAQYWATGYNTSASPASFNPYIGEPRNNNWGLSGNHNGSQGGGYAYAIHFSNGVDLFVAVNQNNSKNDAGGDGFSSLYTSVVNGVNTVDWEQVEPYPQIQLAP